MEYKIQSKNIPNKITIEYLIDLIYDVYNRNESFEILTLFYNNKKVPINSYYKNETILTYSIKNEYFDIIEYLLDFKYLKLNKKNKYNELPYDLLIEKKKKYEDKHIDIIVKKRLHANKKKYKLKEFLNLKDKKWIKLSKENIKIDNILFNISNILWKMTNRLDIKNYNKMLESMLENKKSLTILDLYKIVFYTDINNYLRYKYNPNKKRLNVNEKIMNNMIDSLDNIMIERKTNSKNYYYRGVNNIDFIKDKQFIDKGFLSISSNMEVSKKFTNKTTNCCLFRFKLPKGVKYFNFKNIEKIDGILLEDEILLERNLKFKIIGYDKKTKIYTLKIIL